jgi:isopenicillin N synthase-like dioxygenase
MGYSQTVNDQDELLQIEAHLWAEYLPAAVAELLWSLNELSRTVLTELFVRAGVDPSHIDTVASGVSKNEALQYCIFNHYRSALRQSVGLTAHKDSGFITTLYTTEPGLESWKNDRWVPLDPLESHFTVVLGHSFEVLTAKMSKPTISCVIRIAPIPRGSTEVAPVSRRPIVGRHVASWHYPRCAETPVLQVRDG